MAALFHITPQGRILACKNSPQKCLYREYDHFPSKEKAAIVLNERKNRHYQSLSLKKSSLKIPLAEKNIVKAKAREAEIVDDYISLGEIFFNTVRKRVILKNLTAKDLFDAEEIELTVINCFKQLAPYDEKMIFKKIQKKVTVDFIPSKINRLFKDAAITITNPRKCDWKLHGYHRPAPLENSTSMMPLDEGDYNIRLQHPITGELFWWGDLLNYHNSAPIATSVKVKDRDNHRLLRGHNLYPLQPPADSKKTTVFSIPAQPMANTFFLHQFTHLIQDTVALPTDEAFARWATVKKYSKTMEASVWCGFPTDPIGVSPQELLPAITEVLFLPTLGDYSKIYQENTENLHECLLFTAGVWLALGHKNFKKS